MLGRKACFAVEFFDTRDRTSAEQRPVKSLVLCISVKIHSDILLATFPNFTGSKSTKFNFDFRHQSPLKRSGFKTERHVEICYMQREHIFA